MDPVLGAQRTLEPVSGDELAKAFELEGISGLRRETAAPEVPLEKLPAREKEKIFAQSPFTFETEHDPGLFTIDLAPKQEDGKFTVADPHRIAAATERAIALRKWALPRKVISPEARFEILDEAPGYNRGIVDESFETKGLEFIVLIAGSQRITVLFNSAFDVGIRELNLMELALAQQLGPDTASGGNSPGV